jgi:hypothetical protein
MAGSTTQNAVTTAPASDVRRLQVQHNNLVDDAEKLRVGVGWTVVEAVEDLGAGADITERGFVSFPVAMTLAYTPQAIHKAASAGIDGSNTAVITIRNITTATDMASVTLSANVSANTASALTASSTSAAAGNVIGIVVTQGTNANLAAFNVVSVWRPQTVDAASDLVSAKIGDNAGVAIAA